MALAPEWTIAISVLASGAIGLFMRALITESVKSAVKHEYDLKLETVRSQLQAEHEVLAQRLRTASAEQAAMHATAMAAFADSHRAVHSRRLEAMEVLWKEVRKLHREAPPITGLSDLLVESEFATVHENPVSKGMADQATMENIAKFMLSDVVDEVRPFIGEYAYFLFQAYRGLTGRVTLLLGDGVRKGNVRPWYRDKPTLGLIESALSAEEMAALAELKFGQFRWTRDIIERKILAELASLTSGQQSAEAGLERAMQIQAAMVALTEQRKGTAGP